MTRTFLFLCIALFVSSSAWTQTADSTALKVPPWALHLDFISTNGVFLEHRVSPALAYRFGLTAVWDSPDLDETRTSLRNTYSFNTISRDTILTDNTRQSSNLNISGSAVGLLRIMESDAVTLHGGIGPYLTYEYFKSRINEKGRNFGQTSNYKSDADSRSWTYGVLALLSARVHISPSILIHADYQLSVGRMSSQQTNYYVNDYSGYKYETTDKYDVTSTVYRLSGFTAGLIFLL